VPRNSATFPLSVGGARRRGAQRRVDGPAHKERRDVKQRDRAGGGRFGVRPAGRARGDRRVVELAVLIHPARNAVRASRLVDPDDELPPHVADDHATADCVRNDLKPSRAHGVRAGVAVAVWCTKAG